MANKFSFNNILTDISKIANLDFLKKEISKVATDIKNLKSVKQAESRYKVLTKKITVAQKQVDREVHAKVTQVKKAAAQLEKTLESYKKKLSTHKKKAKKAGAKRKVKKVVRKARRA